MIEGLVTTIEQRFAELERQMADPEVIADRRRAAEVGREYRQLQVAAGLAAEWRRGAGAGGGGGAGAAQGGGAAQRGRGDAGGGRERPRGARAARGGAAAGDGRARPGGRQGRHRRDPG